MTPRTHFDAIIIGAGPAGSSAAILLARAGWTVALVERQRFPRRKVCGECVAASNLPLLDALGIGEAFAASAGPALKRVTLLQGEHAVSADLPAADHDQHPWGRALGREILDTLLLDQAGSVGAAVFQPWSVEAIRRVAGAWQCDLRAADSKRALGLHSKVLIDAHGAWEALPAPGHVHRRAADRSELIAFKANFTDAAMPTGTISMLALDGGYGGMVVADGRVSTLACCIRRDRLHEVRMAAPGKPAGDAVEAWLKSQCGGVRRALQDASRDGRWLAAGPLQPGARIGVNDEMFRIGNAAGEAHPLLGEGMSMALQSAAMLCSHLLGDRQSARMPGDVPYRELRRRYRADWQRNFVPRLRLASAFAHLAMRPAPTAAMMTLTRVWPGLLTQGARWGGKVCAVAGPPQFDPGVRPIARVSGS
jgi:flavin-dependent dehydrogenase